MLSKGGRVCVALSNGRVGWKLAPAGLGLLRGAVGCSFGDDGIRSWRFALASQQDVEFGLWWVGEL